MKQVRCSVVAVDQRMNGMFLLWTRRDSFFCVENIRFDLNVDFLTFKNK